MNELKTYGLILFLFGLIFSSCSEERANKNVPRFNHVMLFVADLDRSISFYENAIGLKEYKRIKQLVIEGMDADSDTVVVNMAFLRFEGSNFILELSEQVMEKEAVSADGLYQHVGIEVEDIGSSSEKALAGGAVELSAIRSVSAESIAAKTAFFAGPDGERIELMEIIKGDF